MTFLDVPAEMRSVSDRHLRLLITEEVEAPQSIRIAESEKNEKQRMRERGRDM